MIRSAYSYGLTPAEVKELTLVELMEFVQANAKRDKEFSRFITKVGYSTGIIASMALSKRRPKYEEVWGVDKSEEVQTADQFKKQMIAWAANVNRLARDK